jgi:hypothetical protein
MEVDLDPVDLMTYEHRLVEFVGEERVESEFSEFRARIESNETEPSFPTVQSGLQQASDPILSILYHTREAFNDYWREGTLPVFNRLLDMVVMGHAVAELNDVDFVDPTGDLLNSDLQAMYADRIWASEDFWDAIFELEVGTLLHEYGLDPKLIEEGSIGGPDIYVDSFRQPIWIECKRKRTPTDAEADWEAFKQDLLEEIWERISIGDDSFAVRITADFEVDSTHIEALADTIASLVERQGDCTTIDLAKGPATIELVSYYEGARCIDITAAQEGGLGFLDLEGVDMQDVAEQLRPHPNSAAVGANLFGHLEQEFDPDADDVLGIARQTQISETKIRVRNALLIEFDFRRTIDYVAKIESSIDMAKENLSGKWPSVVCIQVPFKWLKEMKRMLSVDRSGITQKEHLKQSINGELNANSTINAIILMSRSPNRAAPTEVSISRFGEPYLNLDPEDPLPDEFELFLDQLIQNEEN